MKKVTLFLFKGKEDWKTEISEMSNLNWLENVSQDSFSLTFPDTTLFPRGAARWRRNTAERGAHARPGARSFPGPWGFNRAGGGRPWSGRFHSRHC